MVGGDSKVLVTPHGLDWDPNTHHEYRIDANLEQDKAMIARAQYYSDPKNTPYYNLLIDNTCVGLTVDILDQGDIDGPWYIPDPATGYGFDDWLEDWVPGVHKTQDLDNDTSGSSSSSSSSSNDGGSSGRPGHG